MIVVGRGGGKDVAASAIPGAMIVIGSHNRVIFERTVAFRDVAEDDPLRPDAIWRIYSMTKPIVTAAAMVPIRTGRKPRASATISIVTKTSA